MGIVEPTLLLSTTDREILLLLGQLVLATGGDSDASNIKRGEIALSPSEAERLLGLLEQFANSKLFIEGAHFTEGLANGDAWTDDRLKEIYLSWRSKRGRTRVASTYTWNDFVIRAGFNTSENAWMWPRHVSHSPSRPMTLEYFLAMEKRLLVSAKLHPRVAHLIITFVKQATPHLKSLRNRDVSVSPGSVTGFVSSMVFDLGQRVYGLERAPMTRLRLVALCTIVMDTSALFSTRDWTAAGSLSTLAATVPDAIGIGTKNPD